MRVPSLLLLVLLIPSLLPAQQGEDIRISPPEMPYYALPTQYRIQSADRIGDITLAVWGTARSLDRSNVAGELRYQILDGAALLDTQKVLTDTAARPFDFVQVIPGYAFFLVVWRDARTDAPGLYAQRVGKDGSLLGTPVRISPGYVRRIPGAENMLVFGGKERLLVWLDGRSDSAGLYALRLSRSGGLGFPAAKIGEDLRNILRFNTLPGATILRTSDTVARLIRADGTLDGRTALWPRNSVRYNLGPDASIAILSGKRLDYFASIFDQAPAWTALLPALDSANTAMITREAEGSVVLYFMTTLATGEFPNPGVFRISWYRLRIRDQRNIDTPSLEYQDDHPNGVTGWSKSGSYTSFELAGYQQGCDNSGQVSLFLYQVSYTNGYRSGDSSPRRKFSIDGDGNFHPDSTGLGTDCSLPSGLPVSRIKANNFSTIVLSLGDTALHLSAPVGRINPPAFQLRPKLISSSADTALCYWEDQRLGTRYLFKVGLPFRGVAASVGTFQVPELSSVGIKNNTGIGNRNYCGKLTFTRYADGVFSFPGSLSYSSNQRMFCNYDLNIAKTPLTINIYDHHFDLNFPGDMGWSTYSHYTSSPTPLNNTLAVVEPGVPVAYDPHRREMLVLIERSSAGESQEWYTPWALVAIDRKGDVVWKVDTLMRVLNRVATILPVDSLRYLHITDTSATLYRLRSVMAAWPLSKTAGAAHYYKLYGPYFLRAADELPNMTRRLEVYHIDSGLVAAADVPLPMSATSPQVVQRVTDSLIAVLWGTENNGVHATLLDNRLNVITSDMLISSTRSKALNPAGIFAGDTLYAVWEDYRNGEADIYGTGVVLPSIPATLSVAAEEPAGTPRARVIPNPAGDAFRIEFGRPTDSDTELELIDMRGFVVGRDTAPAGASTATISTREYGSGLYRLRWRRDGGVESLPVMIVH